MAKKVFPKSRVPVRKSVDLLPNTFKTKTNDKFLSGVLDPLVQPGVLEKSVGFIGRRYGKTYRGDSIYVDNDETLRSRYQLEPGVVYSDGQEINDFFDYLDFKNQLKFFNNTIERDDKLTLDEHYTWDPPINWDKFVNYREYFWEPAGPPPVAIFGQSQSVVSTFSVSLGVGSSFIFSPDGKTNNPTITLYRGQTYRFNIDAPGEGFIIRTNYDTGSLLFNPNFPYSRGQLAVFDGKIWKATRDLLADPDRIISEESPDWELVSAVSESSSLDFNDGVTNNGIERGILEFTVPYDAPSLLFYQSLIDPNRVGQFFIQPIESNTAIDVEQEVLGKQTYTSGNGVNFTNGLVVEFRGKVEPIKYTKDTWLVEGVGKQITLTKFADLIVPPLPEEQIEPVLFDNEGFDNEPFDDATNFPKSKDYITIERDCNDANPWSRYNRWFHRSVLEFSYKQRGQDYPETEQLRAKRPIIEFKKNLQLFNHGSRAKKNVDFIDTFTDDVFSKIEGTVSYSVDGNNLFDGARLLVVSDTDNLANNKIYQVKFITHKNRRQITLVLEDDGEPIAGDCVLVRRGNKNANIMYHYNGTHWVKSQQKFSVNQSPLFDVYDENHVSFSDTEQYPASTFEGSKLVSYKKGTGIEDPELGFSVSYLNIDNVGDIEFEWNWDSDEFQYTIDQQTFSKALVTGFYRVNEDDFQNGWIKLDSTYVQPIIDSKILNDETDQVEFKTVTWLDDDSLKINFYLNGELLSKDCRWFPYFRNNNTFRFSSTFPAKSALTIKVVGDVEPNEGYYEIPVGLEKNPLNKDLTSFTFGQAAEHLKSSLEFDESARFCEFSIIRVRNLRDIDGYQNKAVRFLKHAGLAPLAISLLCDKEINIIKAIRHSKKSYTEFKNSFIERASKLDFNDSVPNFVDEIITDLSKTKNSLSTFANSDMIGSGAFTSLQYVVEDEGINTFSLSERFSLNEPSQRAVYVYINEKQLLNSVDYEFDNNFGFVLIKKQIQIGDVIEIREYVSTAVNFIPATPTSMGLYKKFTPLKFVDDTYREPRQVIQGHDGSITLAYNDFRDDLLLELEFRIYNNIKVEYDEAIFDLDSVIGSYYSNNLYTKSQFDKIAGQEFLKWIQNTDINYTQNTYFIDTEPFTYTYSRSSDPTRTARLPGFWRGIYQWFYDTDRPHRCPWEMLGFSQEPSWWESQYGPKPYTSNNLILWEDLRDGIIRQGTRSGIHDRYKRPSLLQHLPVDENGDLLSPLTSNLAQEFSLIFARREFVLGDIAPVEYGWRSSSEWPYTVVLAMALMKPYEFISDSFIRSNVTVNSVGQQVSAKTGQFIKIKDFAQITNSTYMQSSGLLLFLVDYVKSKGMPLSIIDEKISSIDVKLSSRISGFVDKSQQRYLLDSKNPSSTSGRFIPKENYNIFFNTSSPIATVSYSGVIVEKTEGGWIINGYDSLDPFFKYFAPVPNQQDPTIFVGGVSEPFVEWSPENSYNNGQIVKFKNEFYRSIKTHRSDVEFEVFNWRKLPKIPIVGGVSAQRRRNFNRFKLLTIGYGSILNTIQEVVDFFLGYEDYLISQGFVFDNYDYENQVPQDWTTASKEFMFWTRHNWSVGSVLTLSPLAQKVKIIVPIGVASSLLDGFYDYQVLKADGKPLLPNFIDVSRDIQEVTISTTNTPEGIYYIKIYDVLKEHVVIFDDKTVFNDVLYDETSGYRQDRIKTQSFRTTDWDGDYTSPGFIFDNVKIEPWQPFVDYKLGDIVSYRSFFWTSNRSHAGTLEFDDSLWVRTEVDTEQRLVANFDFKINQIEDYFNVDSEGIGELQRDLARHTVGYQKREYLQELAEDPITQFQLYQGFIRDKGTSNSIVKVFDKLSRSAESSVVLNEEWAIKVGQLGGIDQVKEYEFDLERERFLLNPQPLLFTEQESSSLIKDKYYRILKSKFTIKPKLPNLGINPVEFNDRTLRTPGYVSLLDVDFVLSTKDDIPRINIANVKENDHFWITFNNHSWTVLRYNSNLSLVVVGVEKLDNTVRVFFNQPHHYKIDDYIGITGVKNLTGFYKILSITSSSVTVSHEQDEPEFEQRVSVVVSEFANSRFERFDLIDKSQAAKLPTGARLWVDQDTNNRWQVREKQNQFSLIPVESAEDTNSRLAGWSVLYNEQLRQVVVGIPGSSQVISYSDSSSDLLVKQILPIPVSFSSEIAGSYGKSLAASQDGRWLFVGSPESSGIGNNYLGNYDPTVQYFADDIVLFSGQLWRAKRDTNGDGSTIDLATQDWEPATVIPATITGRSSGFTKQGMVTVYEYVQQQWQLRTSFVSPRPAESELFGTKITISQKGRYYYAAISAVGSLNRKGRVYLYVYKDNKWQHDIDRRYAGVYESSKKYPQGSIVWYDSRLWIAQNNITGDDSTIGIDQETSTDWKQLDEIAGHNSLPQTVAIQSSDSTIDIGLLTDQQVEVVNEGDLFGSSISMSANGDVLVVGAPNSSGDFYETYKGVWKSFQQYSINEIVKFEETYYKLLASSSLNQKPSDFPQIWESTGEANSLAIGKVFVYLKSFAGKYDLKQTITLDTLVNASTFLDKLESGDQFGFSIAISKDASVLVVSAPRVDFNFQDQGAAYVFKSSSTNNLHYTLVQKLESFEFYPNEFFGQSIAISSDANKIVVGARNTPFTNLMNFDNRTTIFDKTRTNFVEKKGFAGAVYIFENKDESYFLTERLEANLSPQESFGFSVDCSNNAIVVGSPTYVRPIKTELSDVVYTGPQVGNIRFYKKTPGSSSWNILSQEEPIVEIEKIKKITLYDNDRNVRLTDIDYVDHPKLKVLNIADQEIKFKTLYDPAVYNVGTENQVVDDNLAWAEKHVGELWWNVSKAKWLYHEQADISYRFRQNNRLAEGASIEVCEWVESRLLPSEWSVVADTNEGLGFGISGQPLHPNDDVMTVKQFLNPVTGLPSETVYYYWVTNKAVVPTGIPSRRISSAEISTLIRSPETSGIPYISIVGKDQILAYNFERAFVSNNLSLNIQYKNTKGSINLVHNEYQLLTEGTASSKIPEKIKEKWLDSLIGFNNNGDRVPDISLPAKQRYGIQFRPRQSMFIDRIPILKTTIEQINSVLALEPFADLINFTTLESFDTPPSQLLNLYDVSVPSKVDLITVGTVRVRQAKLRVNIVNNRIETIDVIDTGFGYKTLPVIEISGDGQGATARATLDRDGRVIAVSVVSQGRKYTFANATVRKFSVLVEADETSNGFWSIYKWDEESKKFLRSKTQSFDTRRFWNFVDWWAADYSPSSKINKEIEIVAQAPSISTRIGDLVRVKEFAQGGWAVFEKVSSSDLDFLEDYKLVARKNGTIQLSESLYNQQLSGIGYDSANPYDSNLYDLGITKELRNIFKTVEEDIFVGEYQVQWNMLFFTGLRYAFSEQQYIDWAFKTSFLDAIHNVGDFEQKVSYQSDRLESFKEYIEEVKPYRTSIREYISRYSSVSQADTAVFDFDLPPRFSKTENKIIPVRDTDSVLNQYPWRAWQENKGFSIVDIKVIDPGQDYSQIPQVIIEGDGQGAEARAAISNNRIAKIKLINSGFGYTKAPDILIVGGNTPGSSVAKATAIIGDSKIRSFDITLKFDRVSKVGTYENLNYTDVFTATGATAAFDLTYPPNINSSIKVTLNDQLVVSDEYKVSINNDDRVQYIQVRGKIVFVDVPKPNDVIKVTYEKNDNLLDSVNRINKYYDPAPGMKGRELDQLMTGVDFGGVQVQGTTFDITGGWDALPWFTDAWDSVEGPADFYFVFKIEENIDSSIIYRADTLAKFDSIIYKALKTNVNESGEAVLPVTSDGWEEFWEKLNIHLPAVPKQGEIINVYYKKANETRAIRIDDPNFSLLNNTSTLSNSQAIMPTIIGDGSTLTVDIQEYLTDIDNEDTIIFRKVDSDGAAIIDDPNILDTEISGGSVETIASGAYRTATGMTPEEIVIEGSSFISPDQVPAPEENVPGQVLESLSIKVFSLKTSGSIPLETISFRADGDTLVYNIRLPILKSHSVMIYVDKIKQTEGTDYTIDYANNQVSFTELANGSLVEIISFGVSGVAILDYQEYLADGETTLFLTNADYKNTNLVFTTINGKQIDVEFVDSTGITDTNGKALLQFGVAPANGEVIKAISLGFRNVVTDQPIIRINQQVEVFDGSSRSFLLNNFINFGSVPLMSSVIVEVNNVALRGVDTVYVVYNGTDNQFVIGTDPFEQPGAVLSSNISVFINNQLTQNYIYDGVNKTVIIEKSKLQKGDVIEITNNFRSNYSINNDILQISSSVMLEENDEIVITWFERYDALRVISDEYTGGKVTYNLAVQPLDSSYVWVYKNGIRLTQDFDFSVDLSRNVVYLNEQSSNNDIIKIIVFGSSIFNEPSAFEIYKDMFNYVHYKTLEIGKVNLTKDLNYFDDFISVDDGSLLTDPDKSKNVAGTVLIGNEQIEYLIKDGNLLKQLRRGVNGSAIAEVHKSGLDVVDLGVSSIIPYKDQQEVSLFDSTQTVIIPYDGSTRTYTISDLIFVGFGNKRDLVVKINSLTILADQYSVKLLGKDVLLTIDDSIKLEVNDEIVISSLFVGPLSFTPRKTDYSLWYSETIPKEYNSCDQVEVFIAGTRLRKHPVRVYQEELGSFSPVADRFAEAEFSVDGVNRYIRLTNFPVTTVNISVIRKVGRSWYDRGELTPSTGITLLENSSPIAKFIAKTKTKLPR